MSWAICFLLGLASGFCLAMGAKPRGAAVGPPADPPVPCIGQRWYLRGVGPVAIVGFRTQRRLGTTEYVIDRVSYDWTANGQTWQADAMLPDFLNNAYFLPSSSDERPPTP